MHWVSGVGQQCRSAVWVSSVGQQCRAEYFSLKMTELGLDVARSTNSTILRPLYYYTSKSEREQLIAELRTCLMFLAVWY